MATLRLANVEKFEPDLVIEVNNYRHRENTVSFSIGESVDRGAPAAEIHKDDIPALVRKLLSVYE